MDGHYAGEAVQHKCQTIIAAVKGNTTSGRCRDQEGKRRVQPRKSRHFKLLSRITTEKLTTEQPEQIGNVLVGMHLQSVLVRRNQVFKMAPNNLKR